MSTKRPAADLFSGVLPLVRVAEAQSFRRAAEQLGVTPAAVSKAIARLETELGVKLLARTSRSVALTDEGALLFERCREAVSQVEAAREQVAEARQIAAGRLSVSLSPSLGRVIVPALGRLTARYPGLRLALSFSDRAASLAADRVDVAVRIGALEGSSLKARLLTQTRYVTAASPAYLARRGAPRAPAELIRHERLAYVGPSGRRQPFLFRGAAGEAAMRALADAPALFEADQGEMVVEAAIAGLGVCQALELMVREHLRAGRLVELLGEHAADGPPVHALWLPGRQGSLRVRVLVQFLVELFATRATLPQERA